MVMLAVLITGAKVATASGSGAIEVSLAGVAGGSHLSGRANSLQRLAAASTEIPNATKGKY